MRKESGNRMKQKKKSLDKVKPRTEANRSGEFGGNHNGNDSIEFYYLSIVTKKNLLVKTGKKFIHVKYINSEKTKWRSKMTGAINLIITKRPR